MFYNCDGIIFVSSYDNKSSLENLNIWYQLLIEYIDLSLREMVWLINKKDLNEGKVFGCGYFKDVFKDVKAIQNIGLDIPDIFSHSIEKQKKIKISPYNNSTSKVKQSKSQKKNYNQKTINRKDIFNFPINNNFSLSNMNYFPNKRNKKAIINSVSLNEDNNLLKDINNNYQIKNTTSDKNKNNNISTSLPKIKIKKNPIPIISRETEKHKILKEKRADSQRNINYNMKNISNIKAKLMLKQNNNNKQIMLEDIINDPYAFYQPAKHSENSFDKIISYGVNTYRGTIRQYNEDRVTI